MNGITRRTLMKQAGWPAAALGLGTPAAAARRGRHGRTAHHHAHRSGDLSPGSAHRRRFGQPERRRGVDLGAAAHQHGPGWNRGDVPRRRRFGGRAEELRPAPCGTRRARPGGHLAHVLPRHGHAQRGRRRYADSERRQHGAARSVGPGRRPCPCTACWAGRCASAYGFTTPPPTTGPSTK